MTTRTFSREYLLNILSTGRDVIVDRVLEVEHHSIRELIFKAEDGLLYRTYYTFAGSEDRNVIFECDDEVKCVRMKIVEAE